MCHGKIVSKSVTLLLYYGASCLFLGWGLYGVRLIDLADGGQPRGLWILMVAAVAGIKDRHSIPLVEDGRSVPVSSVSDLRSGWFTQLCGRGEMSGLSSIHGVCK